MQVVLADLVEELATADPQALGGPGAVAAAGQQGRAGSPGARPRRARRGGAAPRWLSPVAGIGGSTGSSASRCSGRMVRPRAAIAARARAFSSCRTLPGQGRCRIAARASGERESSPHPCLRSSAPEDVLGQERDILGAVAERRDRDPGDVQAVVQVLAEPPGGDLPGQVAMGGRDRPGRRCAGSRSRRPARTPAAGARGGSWPGPRGAARRPRRGRSCRRRPARTGPAAGDRRR